VEGLHVIGGLRVDGINRRWLDDYRFERCGVFVRTFFIETKSSLLLLSYLWLTGIRMVLLQVTF